MSYISQNKKSQNNSALERFIVVLEETEMPTERTSDHRNNKNTIQTLSSFYCVCEECSLFKCFIFYCSLTLKMYWSFSLTPIFKREDKSPQFNVRYKKVK